MPKKPPGKTIIASRIYGVVDKHEGYIPGCCINLVYNPIFDDPISEDEEVTYIDSIEDINTDDVD